MKNKEFINIANEKELMEIERMDMKSIQEGYGHEHEEYLAPEENEIDIVLRYTEEEIEEYQAGRIDLNREAEMASRNILVKSNSEMMEKNKDIKDGKFRYVRVKHLPPKAVAELLIANKGIIIRKIRIPTIRMGEEEQYIPAVRMEDGLFRYLLKNGSNTALNSLIRRYNPNASKQFIAEVYACIQDSDAIEKVNPTMNPNVVPTSNGAWNFDIWEKTHDRSKAFISNTDPEYDKYTFMTKVDTDYNPDAESPVIPYPDGSGDWEVMKWIEGLLNGDGQHPLRTQLLLEIIHCAVRIFTCFGRGVWFIDESKYSKGGQGKGTFCDLIRYLLGINHCKDTEVYYLEDPKKLSGLESCNAIIADEASEHYIKHGANYKRLQRGEPVSVKTLYKDEYTAVFKGLMLQCLNEPLKFAERTGSVERTRVMLTWKTSYTDRASGMKEQRCIKQDFVRRPEVLQYLLKYTLEEMNVTEFSEECLAEVEENLQVLDS